MATTTDKQTLELIETIKKQKAEISSLEKPRFKTNLSFQYIEGVASQSVNLQTTRDVRTLLMVAAFIEERCNFYASAAHHLEVDNPPNFQWQGFTDVEWLHDISLLIKRTQISEKKAKLEALEERLNKVISPELRAKMELEAIQAELL